MPNINQIRKSYRTQTIESFNFTLFITFRPFSFESFPHQAQKSAEIGYDRGLSIPFMKEKEKKIPKNMQKLLITEHYCRHFHAPSTAQSNASRNFFFSLIKNVARDFTAKVLTAFFALFNN